MFFLNNLTIAQTAWYKCITQPCPQIPEDFSPCTIQIYQTYVACGVVCGRISFLSAFEALGILVAMDQCSEMIPGSYYLNAGLMGLPAYSRSNWFPGVRSRKSFSSGHIARGFFVFFYLLTQDGSLHKNHLCISHHITVPGVLGIILGSRSS